LAAFPEARRIVRQKRLVDQVGELLFALDVAGLDARARQELVAVGRFFCQDYFRIDSYQFSRNGAYGAAASFARRFVK
jgi:hypothetical protein